jgi:hypothetical protein
MIELRIAAGRLPSAGTMKTPVSTPFSGPRTLSPPTAR